MPPFRWKTFSKPSAFMKAVAFSQRMPPVQNMATFGLPTVSRCRRTQSGKVPETPVPGSTAPRKVPIATS